MNKITLIMILILLMSLLLAGSTLGIIRMTNNQTQMTGVNQINGSRAYFINISAFDRINSTRAYFTNATISDYVIIRSGYGLFVNSTVYSIWNGTCWVTRSGITYSYVGC